MRLEHGNLEAWAKQRSHQRGDRAVDSKPGSRCIRPEALPISSDPAPQLRNIIASGCPQPSYSNLHLSRDAPQDCCRSTGRYRCGMHPTGNETRKRVILTSSSPGCRSSKELMIIPVRFSRVIRTFQSGRPMNVMHQKERKTACGRTEYV